MPDRNEPPQALRVAIIGAGPAAFYAAEALLKQTDKPVLVDMFDRLPTPFGLVRHGVAPDHQKIKTVTKAFAQVAQNPAFRFFGNVEYGKDITLDDLRAHYHQALFATGAQTDRRLDIPGEDLERSHPATEFVAWYNGHPDYRHLEFDLSQERVLIVGVGNVAVDVARILSRSVRELATTDIADHAIEALSKSRVREIVLVGRRGPAQAAFTNPELKELAELEETDLIIRPDEAALDPLSQDEVATSPDRTLKRKVELIADYASRAPAGRPKRLHLRFLLSPVELIDDGSGAVGGVRLVHNRLERTETGTIAARPTGEEEVIGAGLVFRSVGYRGVPLRDLPFHERWGIVPNVRGRVVEAGSDMPLPGLYVAGWIKRGPTGVIGTNKPDAVETVTAMLDDAAGPAFAPKQPEPAAVDELLRRRGCQPVSFDDWARIDAVETERGEEQGRPRVKFTSVEEMLQAIGRAPATSRR